MSKIRDKADSRWEDCGRCPSRDDLLDDCYSGNQIYDQDYVRLLGISGAEDRRT